MSFYFNAKNVDGSQKRILQNQWAELQNMRRSTADAVSTMLTMTNAALSPAQAYLEFDTVSTIERNPFGEFTLLDRVLSASKSVNIGREVFKARNVSGMDQNGSTSMSGNQGIAVDHTSVGYQGTIIPIHDQGFGRKWREIEAMRADGYDALVDDAREAALALHRRVESALWDGHKDQAGNFIVVDGASWKGLKADPTVHQRTYGTDISAGASTADNIAAELRAARDVLMITNNLTSGIELFISREAMSNLEKPYATTDFAFGSILEYIKRSVNGIVSVEVDPKLTGGQYAMAAIGQQYLHCITGMARGSYALPRPLYNSDFNFIMAQATGFMARSTNSGKVCALYAKSA